MSNSFCGPYAVSHALGVTIKEAAAKIRELTGRRAIFGVELDVMDRLFTRVYTRPAGAHCTVDGFYVSRPPAVYVLAIRGHYLVLEGDRIYDNHGTAPVKTHYQRGKWVEAAWHVRDWQPTI